MLENTIKTPGNKAKIANVYFCLSIAITADKNNGIKISKKAKIQIWGSS